MYIIFFTRVDKLYTKGTTLSYSLNCTEEYFNLIYSNVKSEVADVVRSMSKEIN